MKVENADLTQAKAELEGALETALATLAQVRALLNSIVSQAE